MRVFSTGPILTHWYSNMSVRGFSIVLEYVMGIRLLMNVAYAMGMVQLVLLVGTLPTPAAVVQTRTEITQS